MRFSCVGGWIAVFGISLSFFAIFYLLLIIVLIFLDKFMRYFIFPQNKLKLL